MHVGTLLSFPKLIPLPIYVGMPWGDSDIVDLDFMLIFALESFFFFISYCTLFLCKLEYWHLSFMHHYFCTGYVFYHMLGRINIRYSIMLRYSLLVMLTSVDHPVCGFWHTSCIMYILWFLGCYCLVMFSLCLTWSYWWILGGMFVWEEIRLVVDTW